MNSSFVSLTFEEIKAEGKSSCQRNTRHLSKETQISSHTRAG